MKYIKCKDCKYRLKCITERNTEQYCPKRWLVKTIDGYDHSGWRTEEEANARMNRANNDARILQIQTSYDVETYYDL